MGMGGSFNPGMGNRSGWNTSPMGFGSSPYSVQNLLNRDRMYGGYGANPYSMSMPPPMMPDWGSTQWMNPYSGPYSRPYFPQTTGSFFRNNAPAFGWYGQPETFGRPGLGFRDPYGVNPYSFNYGQQQPMGSPSKGAPQQGYNPYGMYDNQGGFTPSNRPPITQGGGKGGAGGGKGGGQIQAGYNPNAMYNPVYNPETNSFETAGFTPVSSPDPIANEQVNQTGADISNFGPDTSWNQEEIQKWITENPVAFSNIFNRTGGIR